MTCKLRFGNDFTIWKRNSTHIKRKNFISDPDAGYGHWVDGNVDAFYGVLRVGDHVMFKEMSDEDHELIQNIGVFCLQVTLSETMNESYFTGCRRVIGFIDEERDM